MATGKDNARRISKTLPNANCVNSPRRRTFDPDPNNHAPTEFRPPERRNLKWMQPRSTCGCRGNFDLAVLRSDFIETSSVDDIVNKNVRNLEERFDTSDKELLFAIEFKYVINSSRHFVDEVEKDNKKLQFALTAGANNAVNLVFCNTKPKYEPAFRAATLGAPAGVTAIFIQSYYDPGRDKDAKKVTPKPEGVTSDPQVKAIVNNVAWKP